MIKASIILVDDHVWIRKALRRIIQEDPTLQVIHEGRRRGGTLGTVGGQCPRYRDSTTGDASPFRSGLPLLESIIPSSDNHTISVIS